KGSRWAAGLLVLLIAGCVGVGKAAPPPQADSPGTGARVAVRRGRLPGLTSPPYGLGARGKRLEPFVAPAQQEQLDKLAPDAAVDSATCQYKATAGALPLLLSDVMLFRGAAGATQAEAVYRQNHDAVAGSIDFAEVPGLGDGAFAYFSLNALHVKVRSG
ncbi:hypothetical protein, partial [Actinoplanes sp. RD1]|uniref:hypothetical protein n=1 Tax=Actinoplanes sp. RD1 TaxID=3064538 RepID=UPI00274271B0